MMLTGTITRWGARGYGFIRPKGGGQDVFVHIKEIAGRRMAGEILSGAGVEFTAVKDRHGRRAENVRVVGYE